MRCLLAVALLCAQAAAQAPLPAQVAPAPLTRPAEPGDAPSLPSAPHAMATLRIYLPLVRLGTSVNPGNRAESRDFYLQQYLSATGVSIGWSGDVGACRPGETAQAFRDAVLRRINYFRAMAGLPGVRLNAEYNRKAQAAALMMSANGQLSHSPTRDWRCYSADGAQAAGSSNLCLGLIGWDAIRLYILEGGAVGHRRWILYPQTREMGTGDIPYAQGKPAANALWVFDQAMWQPRPKVRDEFVAWPPPGYVPYPVINDHWSLSYPGADFSAATVSMTSGMNSIRTVVDPPFSGYGENTLVWIPQNLATGGQWPRPTADTSFTVNVRNAKVGGQVRNFAYTVVVFDPAE